MEQLDSIVQLINDRKYLEALKWFTMIENTCKHMRDDKDRKICFKITKVEKCMECILSQQLITIDDPFIIFFKNLANNGNTYAQLILSIVLVDVDYKNSKKWWNSAVTNGNSHAQFKLACMYYVSMTSNKIKDSYNECVGKVIDLLKLSAEQKNPNALNMLGEIFCEIADNKNIFDRKDKKKYEIKNQKDCVAMAIEYFKKAKQYGSYDAINNLACMNNSLNKTKSLYILYENEEV
ncbi:MAG: hypothetical protein Edafosvirus4_28 [Edafosvirus sp.]|uniref:Uncharacterized protein n=1 Tax=Edafosvirus sp. TaxID=2487765 RepID=A0A3G4ZUQ4_9VIRU|nr:MAG: hypothetical protein Edafosvirus4_28 [Edafosvirus sp.]